MEDFMQGLTADRQQTEEVQKHENYVSINKLIANCSMNWRQVKAVEAFLLVVLTAMSLKDLKLHSWRISPSTSTTKGMEIPPAASTLLKLLCCFST